MKQSEVKVGMTCLTKVGENMVKVIVCGEAEPTWGSDRTRFRVKREYDGKVLPKTRTAAALREVG